MKRKQKVILGTAIAAFLIIGTTLFYLLSYEVPMIEAMDAMKSDDMVAVTAVDSIVFTPHKDQDKTALIIYPGAKVPPEAYAPIARDFAKRGIRTIIVRMPFNLAIFGINKADKIIDQNKDIQKWYIAGHSLGGTMAARYSKNHQAAIAGLILWASYPESSSNLSKTAMPIMSIYGTNDGIVQPGDISDKRYLLPDTVQWVSITGANHSQFGWYGFQKSDEAADISREEQQQEIVEATMELIKP